MADILAQITGLVTGGADGALLPMIVMFLAIFFGTLAVFYLFGSRRRGEKRMTEAASGQSVVGFGKGAAAGADVDAISKVLRPISKFAVTANEERQGKLRLKLLRAGFFDPRAAQNFYALRIVLAVLLPVLVLVLTPFLFDEAEGSTLLLFVCFSAFLGLHLPSLVVMRLTSGRQRAAREGFPDAVDMLVVCIEAGLGLDAAFSRVGEQIWRAHPVVAQHFALVSAEMRAGATRESALRNFAKRVGVDEIESFVTLLVQSEQLGSSIAQTLRVQAEEMRLKRMMRAEHKAHMLPVLLSIPLVLFIFPAMLIAVLLPAAIRIVRHVFPAMHPGGAG